MKRRIAVLAVALFFTVHAPVRSQPAAPKVQFARDMLPILSTHCFTCHGPDDKLRKAGLRLDSLEAATQDAEERRPGRRSRQGEGKRVDRPRPFHR